MGRKPIEPKDKKIRISIRLRQETINNIKEGGTLQQYIEKLVENDILSKKNGKNGK